MQVGSIGEFLPDDIRPVAGKQRGYRWLCLGVRALSVFQVVITVTVGLVVRERSVRTETILIDVQSYRLRQHAMPGNTRVGCHADEILCGLVGNDIDDARDGIRAIERRRSPVEHLDALHS